MKLRLFERNGLAMIYREQYFPKGTLSDTYSRVQSEFVGGVSMGSSEVPSRLAAKLSPAELADVIAFCLRKEASDEN
ncbi:hypothetical protein VSR82_32770 [Burkholderia sp. JPY481]